MHGLMLFTRHEASSPQTLIAYIITALPPPSLQHLRLIHPRHSQALHRSGQVFADFKQYFRVVEVGGGFDDGSRSLFGFYWVGEGGAVFHEDAAAYEDGFGA